MRFTVLHRNLNTKEVHIFDIQWGLIICKVVFFFPLIICCNHNISLWNLAFGQCVTFTSAPTNSLNPQPSHITWLLVTRPNWNLSMVRSDTSILDHMHLLNKQEFHYVFVKSHCRVWLWHFWAVCLIYLLWALFPHCSHYTKRSQPITHCSNQQVWRRACSSPSSQVEH